MFSWMIAPFNDRTVGNLNRPRPPMSGHVFNINPTLWRMAHGVKLTTATSWWVGEAPVAKQTATRSSSDGLAAGESVLSRTKYP